jgi:hypothetical protein
LYEKLADEFEYEKWGYKFSPRTENINKIQECLSSFWPSLLGLN